MGHMASTVLEFRDVSVVRDGNLILDSVTWSVDSDERWVILGPNGAGKTTLLQIAAAAMHPTTGRPTCSRSRSARSTSSSCAR